MGFGVAIPLIAAGIGAASSIHSSREQSSLAKKNRDQQEQQFSKQEALQRKQEQAAQLDKDRLQTEESDELRSRRTRGRKSLLSGDQQGVDILGQRLGGSI